MKKKSKKKTKYVIFILLIIAIIIVMVFLYIKKNGALSYNKDFKINIGDNVPTEIEYKLGNKTLKEKIIWENLKLEDGKSYHAGNYNGKFLVKDKEQKVILSVLDTIAPTIEGVKNITIYENENIDLLKEIKTSDDSHDKVEIEVKGQYDTSKNGEYKLKYEAKDKSGNITTKEFTLTVKEKVAVKPGTTIEVVGTTSKGYRIEKRNGVYYINNILIANKTYPLPSNYGQGLLPELNNAFSKLKSAASAEGVELKIISGFRSYNSQKSIYNNYVKRDGKTQADTYSARAGHSEHQTGLAIDVNSLNFDFADTKEGQWLQNNAYKYGFIIRYPKGKENITGYRYEPWHLRYIGDLSKELYNGGDWVTLEEYLGITSVYQN